MMAGFQCFYDAWGNLHVQGGIVMDIKTGAKFYVGGGGASSALSETPSDDLTMATAALTTSFVGGSGRNIFSAGLAPRYSGAPTPIGWWMAANPGVWRAGIFRLVQPSTGDPYITDGTDTVATWVTGTGTAPAGDYDSTTYGTTTYGEIVEMVAQPFTLTVTSEGGYPVAIPDATAVVSEGTAQGGTYEFASGTYADESATYDHESAAGWSIEVDPDGTARITDGTDVVAIRDNGTEAGDAISPAGVYSSTAYGADTYNWVTADPEDEDAVDEGVPFTVQVSLVGRKPRAGTVYLKLTEDAGALASVDDPAFGSLPASSAPDYYVALAECDGMGGIEQLHTGMLVWPGGGGGGGLAWVSLTEAEYDALDPKDPDTIYDITDAPWAP